MQQAGDAPCGDGETEGPLRTEAIDERAGQDVADRVRDQERGRDDAELGVADRELGDEDGRRYCERLPVEVIDRRDQA